MNFRSFRNIFRKAQSPFPTERFGGIEDTPSSETIDELVDRIGDRICELCEYGDRLDKLSETQRVYYLKQMLEVEVCNGGFDQFYFNSAGDHAHETVLALLKIGAVETAKTVQSANAQFPGQQVPRDRVERWKVMETIRGNAAALWSSLGDQFYLQWGDLTDLTTAFIQKNFEDFLKGL
jgi:hypothetical protein